MWSLSAMLDQRCCPRSTVRARTCAPKVRIWVLAKMWFPLHVLVPERLSLFWRYEGKVRSLCWRINGGKSVTATKGGGRVAHWKQGLRYQVCCSSVPPLPAQCCSCARKRSVLEQTTGLVRVTGNPLLPVLPRVTLRIAVAGALPSALCCALV